MANSIKFTAPDEVRNGIAKKEGAVTTAFGSSLGGDSNYYATEADGKVYEWNDFLATDAQLAEHTDYDAAVESIIAGCEALYLEFHDIETCDISRQIEDGRIVCFRLSRDVDGAQHGDDETFHGCVVEF